MAKIFNVRFVLESGTGSEYGHYTTGGNVVHVDINANNGTILYTAAHELTHFIKDWNEAEFQTFANFLFEELGKSDKDVTAWVADKRQELIDNGTELTGEELNDLAFEEVVCEACESFITKPQFAESMGKLANEHKQLHEKILNWFKELLGKLKNAVKHYSPDMLDSTAGREVASLTDGLDALVDAWTKALAGAAQNVPTANKNTAQESGVVKRKILGGRYDYKSLISKPDMKVTRIDKQTPSLNSDIISEAKKNAAKIGKENKDGSVSVYVEDIGVDVVLGTTGLKHGLDRRSSINAPVTLQAGAILQNSIKINELTPKRQDVVESYVLIGAASDVDGEFYVVRFVVNKFSNELSSMDVLYAINAKKENRLRSMRPGFQGPVTDSTISISDLLDYVNKYFSDILPEDVLKHYGHTERPSGKLGESALYKISEKSARQMLGEALLAVTSNESESKVVQDYLAQVDKLDAAEAELQAINSELHKMLFTKGARDEVRLQELQSKADALTKQIDKADHKIFTLEATGPLLELKDRAVATARKNMKKSVKQMYAEQRESVQGTVLKNGLIRRRGYIDTMLNRGNKQKNVKPELTEVAQASLDAVDALLGKGSVKQSLSSLLMAYEEIGQLNAADKSVPKNEKARVKQIHDQYDAAVAARLQAVVQKIGNRTYDALDNETRTEFNQMLAAMHHTLTQSNKLFKEGKTQAVEDVAAKVRRQEADLKLETKRGDSIGRVKRFFETMSWENQNPVYAIDRLGSAELTGLFWDLIDGQDKCAHDIEDARALITHLRSKYGFMSWDQNKRKEFELASGQKISLNLQEMMSIYAYSRREQAKPHIFDGGFVFSNEAFSQKASGKWKYHNTAITYRMTEEDLDRITDKLTDEQKGYAKEMQAYLSDVMGAKGNEVSRVLYGIDLFNEEFYFPLKSSDQFLETYVGKDGKSPTMVSLKNTGMTKELVPGAGNPIVLRGFDAVWEEHVDKMSQYHTMVLPIENMQKVLNYNSYTPDGSPVSVENSINRQHGEAAFNYFVQFLTDLNGGITQTGPQAPTLKMFSKFKKMAVGASLSTIVQQPTSIVRAMAEIDAKYFGPRPTETPKGEVKGYEELKRYAGIAIIKEMGGFDTGSSGGATAYLDAKEYKGLDKVKGFVTDEQYRDDLWMKGAQKADELTWTWIWHAVKSEVADKQGLAYGSEQHLKAAGKRFTEVVVRTQVYDSVLSRSGFMRSKSDLNKTATAFMGEQTMSVNMMYSALLEVSRTEKGSAARKKAVTNAAKVTATVYTAQILAQLFSTFIYALRDDDDEDEALLEKWAEKFAEGWAELLPTNMLPYVRDIQSIIQGYDAERTDLSIIGDMIDGVKTIFTTDYSDPDEVWNATEKGLGYIANGLGLPLRNILRDSRAVFNGIMSVTDTVAPTDIGGAFVSGLGFKERAKADRLYTAIRNGDESKVAQLRSEYASDAAYQTAVRTALREGDVRIRQAAADAVRGEFGALSHTSDTIQSEQRFDKETVDGALQAEYNALKRALQKAAGYKAEGQTSEYADTVEEILEDYDGILTTDDVRRLVSETEPATETDNTSATGGSVYTMAMVNAALESGDSGQAVTMIEDLYEIKYNAYQEAGSTRREAQKSARSDVRASLNSYWKEKYIEAYNNGDKQERERIRELLDATGMYTATGGYQGLTKLLLDWQKEARKKK